MQSFPTCHRHSELTQEEALPSKGLCICETLVAQREGSLVGKGWVTQGVGVGLVQDLKKHEHQVCKNVTEQSGRKITFTNLHIW